MQVVSAIQAVIQLAELLKVRITWLYIQLNMMYFNLPSTNSEEPKQPKSLYLLKIKHLILAAQTKKDIEGPNRPQEDQLIKVDSLVLE